MSTEMNSAETNSLAANPIWEQMITEERRRMASQLGVRVSDLEEQENLLLTLAQSRLESSVPSQTTAESQPDKKLGTILETDEEENEELEGDNLSSAAMSKESIPHYTTSVDYSIHIDAERENKGGSWYRLPQVLTDLILMFIGDPDSLGYILMASKGTFVPTERVFKYFCEQIYPRQTRRKVCKIEKWHTWHNMLVSRPRLRMNGIYTLRTMFSKGYCNDAFWEEKNYESVEVKYYRHFRFFNDGYVLYSLDVVEPYEMVKTLERGEPIPKRVFPGRYSLVKNELNVHVQLHYCQMNFELLLLDGDDGFQGKHNMLKLLRHTSSVTGGGRRLQIENVNLPIPVFHDFRFYRFWQLHPDLPNVSLFPFTEEN